MSKNPSENQSTRCPSCTQPVPDDAEHFPFCSGRCRQVDLGKWFNERYMISRPIEQADLDQGE